MPLNCDKITELREARGLTMEQAAVRAGFTHRQRWYRVESGKQADVKLSTLDRIARSLGCQPRELVADLPVDGGEASGDSIWSDAERAAFRGDLPEDLRGEAE